MEMLRPLLLLSLACVGFGAPELQDGPVVMLTHYSGASHVFFCTRNFSTHKKRTSHKRYTVHDPDAQCPCSARVPWDYKHKFLDNEGK